MFKNLPVVFLHAFPLHSAMWESQTSSLRRYPVLTPDLPGFGRHPPGPSHLDGFARSVLGDMDRAGIQRAVIVGLSMGGYVAFRLFAQARERVAGLVLADTRAAPDTREAKAGRTEQAARSRQEGVGWLADALVPTLLGETTLRRSPDVEATVRKMINAADPEGVARGLEAMRDRPDSASLLPEIHVPVLVLVGEEDTLTPVAQSRIIAESIPGAGLEVIPAAGHLSNLEAEGAFNRALRAFMEK